jgi:hypothetical protein
MTSHSALTFVIPVRHPANAKNWSALVRRLDQTVRSVAAQTTTGWRGIVVANEEAELPVLPTPFEVVKVTFPPNPLHELTVENRDAVLDQFRIDKGRRVLAGMLAAAADTDYFMIVDDDDFVSRHLVSHLQAHHGAPGWTVAEGYVWSEGSGVMYRHPYLASLCGTSHIVRTDLYRLPPSVAAADMDHVKSMLGSHLQIERRLQAEGNALLPLPFAGAIYRVGHPEAHSKSRGVLRTFAFNRQALRRPVRALRNLARLRLVSPAITREFGMDIRPT